jgi:acetyl esterase/lipase
MIALVVFIVDATPLIRAYGIAETVPAQLEQAFGPAVPRSLPDAPGLRKPLTLRTLYEAPPAPHVDVKTYIYASRSTQFLKLDLYKSTALSSPSPVVIVVHGGSWNGGDRDDLADLNFYLAARGYAVAAIDYRFAPEFPDPAQTEDLNDAIRYLKSNAAPLGIDPGMFALIGRSAGGHLALLSAYKNADPAIRGVVAFYPPSDQVYGYLNPSHVIDSRKILKDYLGGTPGSSVKVYFENSPIHFVTPTIPPTLLIHGTKDELVSIRQSQMLHERLEVVGRPHLFLELPWATHGCDYVFTGPCGQLSTYAIERFLAAVLR